MHDSQAEISVPRPLRGSDRSMTALGREMTRGYFITGTDTGVGKTVFTSAFARSWIDDGVDVAAYKPACSGAIDRSVEGESRALPLIWDDIEALFHATNGRWPRERICPQTFLAPLSPPAAAALEGREVDELLLVEGYQFLAAQAEVVLVEGAGGFYSPISTNWLNADLAERIGLPVVIVAPHRLGTINQTLLTIEAVRHRGLTVAGVVLNRLSDSHDESLTTNAAEIAKRGQVRLWGEIPFTPASELQPRRLPESMITELKGVSSWR